MALFSGWTDGGFRPPLTGRGMGWREVTQGVGPRFPRPSPWAKIRVAFSDQCGIRRVAGGIPVIPGSDPSKDVFGPERGITLGTR